MQRYCQDQSRKEFVSLSAPKSTELEWRPSIQPRFCFCMYIKIVYLLVMTGMTCMDHVECSGKQTKNG